MSKKHYVVWKGNKTGVFDSWDEVKTHTQGRSDAQFMGFPNKEEAEQAFKATYTKALMQRSLSKNGSTAKTPNSTSKSSKTISVNKSFKKTISNDADINIYCDGACSPNPGKSGTGVAVYHKDVLAELWFGLHQSNGTNNTAELNGMLESLRMALPLIQQGKSVQILSDSKYSIDCITKWAKGWQTKGWTRGKNEEIKNLEIIQECFALYQQLKTQVIINHVKGHANIEGNELSDRMAVLARMNKETNFVKYTHAIDIKTILAMPSG